MGRIIDGLDDYMFYAVFWWWQMVLHISLVSTYFLILNNAKHKRSRCLRIPRLLRLKREQIRDELLKHVTHSERECRGFLRMSPDAFFRLCSILVRHGGLQPTRLSTVEEQIIKFLYIVGHDQRHWSLHTIFRRSGETISRHMHRVLRAIIKLQDLYLRQPDGSEVPPQISEFDRFYPYFKDCVGAIDGTHIRAKVLASDAPRYRGRKEYPTQNVMVACTFDLKFTYVLTGWEGTASDSRIIKNALTRPWGLRIPEGKFYLVDAGYMIRSGLLTPYRGERYHLKEYSNNPPRSSRELFNLRHASLRNAIERSIGVLKKRFKILGSGQEPTYTVKTQNKIIVACCILHNFLRGVDPDESIIAEVDDELLNQGTYDAFTRTSRENKQDAAIGEAKRDAIANAMWADYQQQ